MFVCLQKGPKQCILHTGALPKRPMFYAYSVRLSGPNLTWYPWDDRLLYQSSHTRYRHISYTRFQKVNNLVAKVKCHWIWQWIKFFFAKMPPNIIQKLMCNPFSYLTAVVISKTSFKFSIVFPCCIINGRGFE